MVPLADLAEEEILYMPDEPVDKQDDGVDAGEVQLYVGEFTEGPPEYAEDRIVRHVSKGNTVCYIFCWYVYTLDGDTLQPPEHTSDYFITSYSL